MSKGDPPSGDCRTCRRPWKELAEKYKYWFSEKDGIEYTHHTVGSGVTKGICSGYKTQEDFFKSMRRQRSSPDTISRGVDFEIYVAPIEADALRTLQRAGLLTEPRENYTLPGKQRTWRGVLHTLEEHSLCEGLTKEWYAATILTHISALRDHIAEGMELDSAVTIAMIVGGIIREAEIRFGYVKNQAKTAGATRGKRQTASRESEWAKWQTAANEIWKKHPNWGKPSVAGMVRKEFPKATVRTIRLRIKKPTP